MTFLPSVGVPRDSSRPQGTLMPSLCTLSIFMASPHTLHPHWFLWCLFASPGILLITRVINCPLVTPALGVSQSLHLNKDSRGWGPL